MREFHSSASLGWLHTQPLAGIETCCRMLLRRHKRWLHTRPLAGIETLRVLRAGSRLCWLHTQPLAGIETHLSAGCSGGYWLATYPAVGWDRNLPSFHAQHRVGSWLHTQPVAGIETQPGSRPAHRPGWLHTQSLAGIETQDLIQAAKGLCWLHTQPLAGIETWTKGVSLIL